jgi:IclR family acetate operon transcriptional repressor
MRSLRKMLTNADSNGSVRSVDRALQLLEQLSASRGANLSQLARDTGLAVSTCHRLLTTLQGRGFVHYERKSARWAVGSRALAVGASFANARDLVGLARPIMDRAARESGEIVNLGAAADYDVLFLYRINPRAPTRMSPPAAERIPIHCSSIGKAILAALREPEIRDVFQARPLVARTEKSITRLGRLLAELRDCGRRGFAIDDEENTNGLRCTAAPIFDEFRRPIAAVSIAAPAERLDGEQVAVFGRIVTAAARHITAACGGSPPANH